MTVETPPAADGGLPGPLLQRLCDISKTDHARGCQGRQYSCDCGWDGRTMDTAEEAFAWINAQSARLAEKDRELSTARARILEAELDFDEASDQLATATERLASAEKHAEAPKGEAVAWEHTLHMDLGQTETRLTDEADDEPFGRWNVDYDPFYRVTKRPLIYGDTAPPSPKAEPNQSADKIVTEIEERFPNWRSYRDLIDCIDCTLHDLRGTAR